MAYIEWDETDVRRGKQNARLLKVEIEDGQGSDVWRLSGKICGAWTLRTGRELLRSEREVRIS